MRRGIRGVLVLIVYLAAVSRVSLAEPIRQIVVDGDFSDWADVTPYYDPTHTAMHNGIPDVHDTDHDQPDSIPTYVNHPDVDLVQYKFAHDANNLYAYFRSSGQIGRTQNQSQGRAGRYYVIVTIDVDDDASTGYGLHEGGYYPTSGGYDMNMEIEYYDGAFNTGHYLNHGARDQAELDAAVEDQKDGVVQVLPGSYDYYSQWVWFDDPTVGDYRLPDDSASITFVQDKGSAYQGIIEARISADGHELEMVAPFRGFMKDASGDPIIALGKTLNVSFSLEASGELAPDGQWASDTGNPILNYYLSPVTPEPASLCVLLPGVLVLMRRSA